MMFFNRRKKSDRIDAKAIFSKIPALHFMTLHFTKLAADTLLLTQKVLFCILCFQHSFGGRWKLALHCWRLALPACKVGLGIFL